MAYTKTLKASGAGGDYSLLTEWASLEPDLFNAQGDSHELLCDAFTCNDEPVTIAGFNTSAGQTVTVMPTAGAEHNYVYYAGFIFRTTNDTTAVQLVIADQEYITLKGFTCIRDVTSGRYRCSVGATGNILDSMMWLPDETSGNTGARAIYQGSNPVQVGQDAYVIRNCLIDGSLGEGMRPSRNATLYNNTVINCALDGIGPVNALVWSYNNLAYNNGTDFAGTLPNDASNNASGDATAVGTNSQTGVTDADFEDPLNNDYHPAVTSLKLADTGLNLSTKFTDDLAGDARPADPDAWSIGALIPAGGALPTPPTDVDAGPGYSGTVGTPIAIDGASYTPGTGSTDVILWTNTGSGTWSDNSILSPTFTPDDEGNYTLTLAVENDAGSDADTASLTSGAVPVEWNGPDIVAQTGTEDVLFSFDEDGSGTVASRFTGATSYALAPTSDALPTGLTVNPTTGNIEGTPTEVATRNIIIEGRQPRFNFNGTDQYATHPPWAAEGKPRRYNLSFNANAVSTGTEQHILSGTEGGVELAFYLHATLPVLSIHYRSDTGAQAIEGILDPADEISAGEDYNLEVINLGTGSQILLNGKDVDITAFEASDGVQPALTHIGAKHDGTSFFGGTIWASMLYDESPITNTWANMGNGSLYGELEQAIVLEGEFSIKMDCIKPTDQTITVALIGSPEGNIDNRVTLSGNDVATAEGRILVNMGGSSNIAWPNGTQEVSVNQHFTLEITRDSANFMHLNVDGVDKGTSTPNIAFGEAFAVEGFYAASALRMTAGGTLQNIVIKDLTNNLTWGYPLDEGPTTDTGPELIEGDPTLTGSLSTWDGSTMHLEGLNPAGTFQGTEVVAGSDYHVTFDYNTSAANTFIRLGGGGNVGVIAGPAIGTYDEVLTAGGTGYIMQLLADGTGDFSNFSIKSATGGSIIHNTDPSTPGYNGSWTDTDWTFIANNTRRYPMNDGPDGGGQFKCIDGTGTEQPALAADIIGYDEGAWD